MVSATSQYIPAERKISTRASTLVYNSVNRTRTESNMFLPRRARFSCLFHGTRLPLFARFDASLQHSALGRRAAHLCPAEHVSGAAPRVDQRLGRVQFINLASQPVYVHFDGVGEGVESFIPHMFRDFLASEYAACVAGQIFQQGILLRGQPNVPASSRRRLCRGVQ